MEKVALEIGKQYNSQKLRKRTEREKNLQTLALKTGKRALKMGKRAEINIDDGKNLWQKNRYRSTGGGKTCVKQNNRRTEAAQLAKASENLIQGDFLQEKNRRIRLHICTVCRNKRMEKDDFYNFWLVLKEGPC